MGSNNLHGLSSDREWHISYISSILSDDAFSLSSVITARFLLNMRYMEVYPNSTTMMALTTMAVTIEWQPQSTKTEDCKDTMDDTYQHTISVETGSIASNDTDVVLHPAGRAVFNYDAAKEISGILEKTFCA
jgi:hypothetical protein